MLCGPDKSYFWILSRTPQLPYPIKQELISQAKALGFATDKLIYVDQSAEAVNYESGRHMKH
jgi:apolipoprotein D and lipocalin family protein